MATLCRFVALSVSLNRKASLLQDPVYGDSRHGTACGYKYVSPVDGRHCSEDCTLTGWDTNKGQSAPPAVVLNAEHSCLSEDETIGTFAGGTVEQCAQAIHGASGCFPCTYFSFDDSTGRCAVERTASDDCPEGFEDTPGVSFYKRTGDGNVVLIRNANQPWGGLVTMNHGQQFVALQGTGAAISQTITGLVHGNVYEIRVLAANRPGYGSDETVVIKVDK